MTYIDHFFPDYFHDGPYVISAGVLDTDFTVDHSVVGGVVYGLFTTNPTDYISGGGRVVWHDPRVVVPSTFDLALAFVGPVDYTPGSDPNFAEFAGFTDTGGSDLPTLAGGPNGVMGGIEGTDSALRLRLSGRDDAFPGEAFDLSVDIPTPPWWGFGDAAWTVSLALTPTGLLTAQLSGGEGIPSIPAPGSADGWIAISHLVPETLMLAWMTRSLYPTGLSGEVDYFESWGYDVSVGGSALIPGQFKASLDSASGALRRDRRYAASLMMEQAARGG